MIVYILWGQRICSYEGEYVPEALEVADEFVEDTNGEWMQIQYEKYKETNEFVILKWIKFGINKTTFDNQFFDSIKTILMRVKKS